MKMIPNRHGQSVPVSNEETSVIDKLKESEYLNDSELSDREIALADRLVSRGIVEKKNKQAHTWYTWNVRGRKE